MSSEGWRELVGKEWASCVLHNLPFFCKPEAKKLAVKMAHYQESASNWTWPDFKDKGYLMR